MGPLPPSSVGSTFHLIVHWAFFSPPISFLEEAPAELCLANSFKDDTNFKMLEMVDKTLWLCCRVQLLSEDNVTV